MLVTFGIEVLTSEVQFSLKISDRQKDPECSSTFGLDLIRYHRYQYINNVIYRLLKRTVSQERRWIGLDVMQAFWQSLSSRFDYSIIRYIISLRLMLETAPTCRVRTAVEHPFVQ